MNVEAIQSVLNEVLPKGTFIEVKPYKGISFQYIKIMFAAKDFLINNVQGQRPQAVSLSLCLHDMDLYVQSYCGNGGQHIYRVANLDDAKEKYLAMKSVKIPFRKPQRNEKAVTNAIKKFAENWLKAIRENKDVLMYKDNVDCSIFF